ncbi:hypothetical protein C7S17_4939 [Burkholderia thailandensis]|nr:hypothetical protein [Burkholderia thailandensis]
MTGGCGIASDSVSRTLGDRIRRVAAGSGWRRSAMTSRQKTRAGNRIAGRATVRRARSRYFCNHRRLMIAAACSSSDAGWHGSRLPS